MNPRKELGHSAALGRAFHVDVFEGDRPAFAVVMIGGSGVTPDEYERRAACVDPRFSGALARLEREARFTFVFVCGPADGLFGRVAADPEAQAGWIEHVATEVLPIVGGLPVYLAAHSGGAALALGGAHELDAVFGAGALGADALPRDLEIPAAWADPCVTLVYNRGDGVFARYLEVVRRLEQDHVVRCLRKLEGGHALVDYLDNESFGGLVRRAARIAGGRTPA